MSTEVKDEVKEDVKTQPPYNVILWNDDDHTYEYVIEMLGVVFGHSKEKAFRMAVEVDATGKVIVYSGALEYAEFKRDKVHAYGRDPRIPRCAGSMSATVEAAGE
jgi:ATP-dependent Clp protease adaptor protein ClpS